MTEKKSNTIKLEIPAGVEEENSTSKSGTLKFKLVYVDTET